MVPDADILLRIGRLHNKSVEWLLEGDVSLERAAGFSSYTLIPLYNVEASAGAGKIPIDESVREFLPFKTTWIKAELRANISSLRVLPVIGESMEPLIRSGDVVLIEETHEIRYEGLYVVRLGELILVKRIQGLANGRYALRSENPAYPPTEVDPREDECFAVIGRVIWHGRNVV
jgi:phage repressor protein C with HTH and peptisase S24 domain